MDLRLSVRTKRIALLLTELVASTSLLSAQEKLTLDECREMAKTHSRVLQQKDAEREAAHARKQEVFTKFFPQVTARGAYLHMQKEFHLIDWDNACRATPDADLATLIGKTLAHTPTTNAHTLRDALLDGYARPINRHSLHWRTVAALIRLIPEPYRRRDPAWPDTMRARLEQTAQIAAQP